MSESGLKVRRNKRKGSKESQTSLETIGTVKKDIPQKPQFKSVGSFVIDVRKELGKGEYGTVYLSKDMGSMDFVVDDITSLIELDESKN